MIFYIEIILWTIAVMAGLVAYEFYKSRNGRLRVLIIALFLCKIWVYGGAAVMFLLIRPSDSELLRIIILNGPMFIVMWRLYRYIKMHNS